LKRTVNKALYGLLPKLVRPSMFAVQRQTAGSRERESGKRAPGRAYVSAQPMFAVQRKIKGVGSLFLIFKKKSKR
jgi:hypothetical protein